jgi:hypothetical protein
MPEAAVPVREIVELTRHERPRLWVGRRAAPAKQVIPGPLRPSTPAARDLVFDGDARASMSCAKADARAAGPFGSCGSITSPNGCHHYSKVAEYQ